MGLIVSYDDKFGTPRSEIALDSGDHVLLALDRQDLVITALARNGTPDRILFEGTTATVATICDGLLQDQHGKTTPLQVLAAAVMNLPSADAVAHAFRTAAAG